MRTATLALSLVAGLSMSSLTLAQPASGRVSFTPSFEQGQSMRYALDLDASITQREGEARSFDERTDQTITLDLEVVTSDENGAVLDGKVTALDLGAMWGGRMYQYEWPKVTADVPLRLPPVIILEKLGEEARDVRVKVRVDLPKDGNPGRVVVSGFGDVAKALEKQDVFDVTTLGLLADEQMADALAGAFLVEGASGKSIKVGAGWQTEDRVTLGPAGALEITTAWVLSSFEGGVARVQGTPRAAVARPASADPASPSVSLEKQESSIAVRWNAALGRADSRESTQAMTTVWTLGPLTLTQAQDTTLTVTRKK